MSFFSGAGGLSGALFWRITTSTGPLCLRRWPREHPSREQLDWIHRVLEHVGAEGVNVVPVPWKAANGRGSVEHDDHLWELTRWMPGRALDREACDGPQLESALKALAQFHLAASTFPRRMPAAAPSPGLAERLAEFDRLFQGEYEQLRGVLSTGIGWPEFEFRAHRIVERFGELAAPLRAMLSDRAATCVPLQPCIRDVRQEHVLFEGVHVTGLVDFGAMGIESVAADLARLLGSMVADDQAAWRQGLAAYESVRRCRPANRHSSQRSTRVLCCSLDSTGYAGSAAIDAVRAAR